MSVLRDYADTPVELSLVVPNGVLNLSSLAFPRDSVEIIRESWQEEHQS